MSSDQIVEMIDNLEQEANTIKSESFKLAWYMRGGITYEDVLQLSLSERQMISDLAKENIEVTKKSGLPWF
jgi:hypothetical protein